MAQPDVKQLTRRQLRWGIRQILDQYTDVHPIIADYDLCMGFYSVMWHLAGRPGLTVEEQQSHCESAHATIMEICDRDPHDPALEMVLRLSSELVERAARKTADKQMLVEAETDFDAWGDELDKHLKGTSESD